MDIDPNTNNFNAYLPSTSTQPYPSSFVGGGNIFSNVAVSNPQSVFAHQQQPSLPIVPSAGNSSSIGMNHPQQQAPVFGLIIPGCPVRTDFVPMIDSTNPSIPTTKYSLNISCSTDLNSLPLLSITELVLFVTSATAAPVVPIPPDYGVLCYWQITELQYFPTSTTPESTGFALFGALTSNQPSTIYRTGWSEHERLVAMVQKLSSSSTMNGTNDMILTIGLSIEPIQNVQNILGGSSDLAAPVLSSILPGTMTTPASPTTMPDVGSIMNQTINSQTMNSRLHVAQKIALDLFHFMQSFDTPNGSNINRNMMMVPTNIFDRWYQRFENRYRRDPNFFMKKSD